MKRYIAAFLVCALASTICPAGALAVEGTGGAPSSPLEETPETPADGVSEDKSTQPSNEEEGIMPINETVPPRTEAVLKQGHPPYMEGYPNSSFQPDRTLTRAQAAQVVYRLIENPDAGQGSCGYTDVAQDAWYAPCVRALCALGLFDDGAKFRPDEPCTRAEFVDLFYRLAPTEADPAQFPDVPADHWASAQISSAVAQGWLSGYPDGRFQPDKALTRAEACTMINRICRRSGDSAQAGRLLQLGLFSDVRSSHWAAAAIVEAAVAHTPSADGSAEQWGPLDLSGMRFPQGFHTVGDQLCYVDRHGKLVTDRRLGAYSADANGVLTQVDPAYQMPDVPYFSQIDDIGAWVGCEAVATLSGLQAKGFAKDVPLRTFLDDLPRSSSDPEKGFVGSPYVPDTTKRTRTTIYPAKLAEYTNSYCNGEVLCSDFRGATIEELQRELLAGNCVVGYLTLWWATPFYRNYIIEGQTQRLVSNNHAILVCGYDPEKGYYISDPYNYYNRGQVHQYWENAATFERIWNERKTGMVMR